MAARQSLATDEDMTVKDKILRAELANKVVDAYPKMSRETLKIIAYLDTDTLLSLLTPEDPAAEAKR